MEKGFDVRWACRHRRTRLLCTTFCQYTIIEVEILVEVEDSINRCFVS